MDNISKQIKTAQKNAEIYFYQTRSGLELDVLLQTEAGLVGMEIKSRKTYAKTDLRAMKEVAKSEGKEGRGGLRVSEGNGRGRVGETGV